MVASPCPSQIENSKYASLKFTFVSLAPTLFADENNTVAINKAPTILHILCFIKLPPNKKAIVPLYRPPKVRPKNLTIGGRYFYGKIQL